MKAKLNFGEGGMKGFLVRHVEKFVLGVAALMVVYILYGGATLERFEEGKNPQDLQSLAQRARSHITSTTWDQMKDGEGRDITDIEQRLKTREGALPTLSDAPYRNDMAWLPPTFPLRTKRVDPEIFAPVKVEAIGQYGPVAINRQEGETNDPITDAEVKKEEEKKPRRPPKPSGRSSGDMSMSADSSMMSSMPYGAGGGAGGSATRRPTKEQLDAIPGFQVGGAGAMMMEGSSSGESSMSSGGSYPGGSAAAPSASGPIAKGFYFVAIKAVFQIKKQWEEYERCFADTGNYEPGRDTPKIVYFKVERAEVAGPNEEEKWIPLNTGQNYYNFMDTWAGAPDEIAHPDYLDPAITMPAPPLINRPLDPLMLHSEVPRRPVVDPVALAKANKPKPGDTKLEGEDNDVLDVKKRQSQRPMGRSTGGMSYASGMGGMSSMSSEGGMSNPYGGSMNYGSEMSSDSSGYGGYGGMAAVSTAPTVDYKLIRFYDFLAQPGKKYRYRVQIWLEDPNHPLQPEASPKFASLDDPVVLRLREIEKKETEKEKDLIEKETAAMDAKARARLYWRETKWSEPSNVAEIPQQYDVLAGAIEAEKRVENKEANVSFPRQGSEPVAKIMTLVWDPKLAVDVPGETDAYRGSVMNLKQHMEVLHPIMHVLKTLDYDAKTDNVVLDVRGGESMPVHPESKDAEPLLAPGEVLLVDHLGRLQITREAEDMDLYQRYDWPEEKEEKKPAAGDSMNPGGMMDNYPGGMGGGRQRRGRGMSSQSSGQSN